MTPPSSTVKVVVRLRPMNDREKKFGSEFPVVTASTNDKSVTVIKQSSHRSGQAKTSYNFDKVFTAFSQQEEVFEETLKPVIGDVLKGYESTVFAYGQTGTGKTYTMEGDIHSDEKRGVIPRAAEAIFESLKKPEYANYTVSCSYLEIYNEDLCDLLVSNDNYRAGEKRSVNGSVKLDIMEGKNGPFCKGLSEKVVCGAEDVLNVLQQAQQNRKVGETKMNKASSRSHCIFTIKVEGEVRVKDVNDSGKMDFVGKLHLVDLAGSECAKTANLDKATAEDASRERERMNINRSLLTLGRVISTLKEQGGKKHVRIPYRDSKLTRILQESLGGRCKTIIIATLSPSVTAVEESLSTLNYAQAANGIINKPVSSSLLALGSSNALNTSVSDQPAGYSVEHWHEMECRLQYMSAQVEEAQSALARKHLQQQELVARAEKAESVVVGLEKEKEEIEAVNATLKENLETETSTRKKVEESLRHTEHILAQTSTILHATRQTEIALTGEATTLLSQLKASIEEGKHLQGELSRQRDLEVNKRQATKDLNELTIFELNSVNNELRNLIDQTSRRHDATNDLKTVMDDETAAFTSDLSNILEQMSCKVESASNMLFNIMNGENGLKSTTEMLSNSINAQIEERDNTFKNGEEQLSRYLIEVKNQMKSSNLVMNHLHETQIRASEKSLQSIRLAVEMNQKLLKEQYESLKLVISRAQEEKSIQRKAMENLVQNWNKSSSDSLTNMNEVTSGGINSISAFVGSDVLENKRNINSMFNVLEQHRAYVESDGKDKLLNSIHRFSSDLNNFSDFRSSVEEEAKRQHENFARNLMTGLQQLISSEFRALEEKKKEAFVSEAKMMTSLLVQNDKNSKNATELLENSTRVNESLCETLESSNNFNKNAESAFHAIKETFERVQTETSAANESCRSFCSQILVKHKESSKVDENVSSKICDQLDSDIVKNHESFDALSRDIKLDFASKDKILFNTVENEKNVLSQLESEVEASLTERKSIQEKMAKHDSDLTSEFHEFSSKVAASSEESELLYNEVLNVVSHQKKVAMNSTEAHRGIIVKKGDELSSNFAALRKTTEAHSTLVETHLRNVLTQVDDFSHKCMECEIDVPLLPAITTFDVNENLSKTRPEKVILGEANLLELSAEQGAKIVTEVNKAGVEELIIESVNVLSDVSNKMEHETPQRKFTKVKTKRHTRINSRSNLSLEEEAQRPSKRMSRRN